MAWPYHLADVQSCQILKAKQGRAWSVAGWETARELPGSLGERSVRVSSWWWLEGLMAQTGSLASVGLPQGSATTNLACHHHGVKE